MRPPSDIAVIQRGIRLGSGAGLLRTITGHGRAFGTRPVMNTARVEERLIAELGLTLDNSVFPVTGNTLQKRLSATLGEGAFSPRARVVEATILCHSPAPLLRPEDMWTWPNHGHWPFTTAILQMQTAIMAREIRSDAALPKAPLIEISFAGIGENSEGRLAAYYSYLFARQVS